jgi:mycoredoxin
VPRSVIAYVTNWCPDCTRSRRVLQQMGIRYHEIDIESVRGAEAEMRSRNGGSGKVPTILIDDVVLIEPSDAELRDALKVRVSAKTK